MNNGVQIKIIEDQHIEEKQVDNPQEAVQEFMNKSGINQNPFIDPQEQVQSYMNNQNNNDYYKFVPKPGDNLSNREVKLVDMTDDFKIQIEIKMDMPSNK